MNGQRSGRVYLAEVLVALFAIFLLAALFLPMWQQSRSRSYATCSNNLRQCALGLMQYAETHRQFPGYANVVGGKRASWVVPILPQLERNDLYRNWSNESIAPIDGKRPDLVAGLSQLVCPNDPGAVAAPTNCRTSLTAVRLARRMTFCRRFRLPLAGSRMSTPACFSIVREPITPKPPRGRIQIHGLLIFIPTRRPV